VIDIARGIRVSTFGQPASGLEITKPAQTATPAPYYLRLALLDKPGALAKVAAVLGDAGVSINRMRQRSHDQNTAPVLIVTHKTTRAALDEALAAMVGTNVVEGEPIALRIERV
jgi:homoserine dehydrogenase